MNSPHLPESGSEPRQLVSPEVERAARAFNLYTRVVVWSLLVVFVGIALSCLFGLLLFGGLACLVGRSRPIP